MPKSLSEIPPGFPITEKDGSMTEFFRFRWEELIDGFQTSPLKGSIESIGLNVALPATSIYLTKASGLYRVSFYLRKTTADGVSSSLTVTLGWTESGVPLTSVFAALTADTSGANQSGQAVVFADQSSDLTIAIAYASNTPGNMKYRVDAVAELLQ